MSDDIQPDREGLTAHDARAGDGNQAAPTCDYDTFVDWDKRLAREAPLFRRVFDETHARTVLDVGAGSARHSIMFASWGLDVIAVDPDDSMLARAEANIAEHAEEIAASGGSLQLVRGGFGDLERLGLGPCDALTCTGNALPHVEGIEGLRTALADFAAVTRVGGAVVLHLLNHAHLLSARVRSMSPVVRDSAEGETVFLRVIGYPPGDEYLDLDFLTLSRDAQGEWAVASRRSMHTALPIDTLERELPDAGFDITVELGTHEFRPLDPATDESVIVIAKRAG